MDEERQHLEHEPIPVMSEPDLRNLCDATASIDENKWIENAKMDKLKAEEMEKHLPVVNSLVWQYKVLAPQRSYRSSLANLSWQAQTSPAMPHLSIQTAKESYTSWP